METELKSIQQILDNLTNISLPVWGGLLTLVWAGLAYMVLRASGKRDNQLMPVLQTLASGQGENTKAQVAQTVALQNSQVTNHSILEALVAKLDYHVTQSGTAQQTILSVLETMGQNQISISEMQATTFCAIKERDSIQQRMDNQERELTTMRGKNAQLSSELQTVKELLVLSNEATKKAELERDETKIVNARLENDVHKLKQKVAELERALGEVKAKSTGESKVIPAPDGEPDKAA